MCWRRAWRLPPAAQSCSSQRARALLGSLPRQRHHSRPRRSAENYPPEAGASGGAGEGGGEGEEALDDEELARRLQEEEEAEHYRRMLAMAGAWAGTPAGMQAGTLPRLPG